MLDALPFFPVIFSFLFSLFSEQPGPDTSLRVALEPILPCAAVYPWKIGCQVLNTHILKRWLMVINGSVIFFFVWFLFGFVFFLFFPSLPLFFFFFSVEAIAFPSFPLRGHVSKLMNGRNTQTGKSPLHTEHLKQNFSLRICRLPAYPQWKSRLP